MTGDDVSRDDEAARRAREDAEWRSIVDNYGDRPDVVPAPEPEPEEPIQFALPPELGPRSWEAAEEDERYVPPEPPPVPRPHGLRLAAWLGLFGVPTVVLVCIVLHVSLPSPLGFLALVWFVGGFGYLVATMNDHKDSGGGWDDGAVV
ncbi:MAG TPA: hypothetical protein VFE07_14305 [Marmoricola sp.]|nr:hypothetical protein [Marmoricola sp.]